MNLDKFELQSFGTFDRTLLHKLGYYILNIYKKYFGSICFIVKKGYAMEDMSTKDLISYIDIKLLTNGLNIGIAKKWFSEYAGIWYINVVWCQNGNWTSE